MRKLTIVLITVGCVAAATAQKQPMTGAESQRPLVEGLKLERELTTADKHIYVAALQEGAAIIGEADQEGIDLMIDITAPDGQLLERVDSPNGLAGAEFFDFTAPKTGT